MRYSSEHAAKTRRRIVEAGAVAFRQNGRVGSGVDQVAAEAGVTSGAIYRQFGSKDGLFVEVIKDGMARLSAGLLHIQERAGADWVGALVDYYLGAEHVDHPGSGCVLPGLAVDVGRDGEEARRAFREGLAAALAILTAKGLDEATARAAFAQLVGSVILARACASETERKAFAEATRQSLQQQSNTLAIGRQD